MEPQIDNTLRKIGLMIGIVLISFVIILSTLAYLTEMPKDTVGDEPSVVNGDPSLMPNKLSAVDKDKQKSATAFSVDTNKLPKVMTGQ